jgi:copper chaperone CopZ
VVHIQGRNPDQFVLVAGHLDSWHVGITDNGTGNAACLELARVLHQHRDQLERGVKIAWWPGHSTGRYAGSTWYCDNHWEELNRGCVAYLNIDSPGSRGATWYGSQNGSAELAALGQGVIRDLTGQEADFQRPLRAGDQSFFGPGVPSLYCLLGNMPNPAENWYAVGGSGMNWWWHTEYDTLDTADRNVLATDTQIYALTVLRLCNAVVLPIQTERCAAEITRALESLPGTVDVHKPLIGQARAVQALCAELDERAAAAAADGGITPAQAEHVNQAILGVLRHLIPVNYTSVGPFHHDPATPRPVVPAMDGVRRLAELQPGTDDYGFLRTSLVRNRNWVSYTLRQAADCARTGLAALGREVTAHV